MRVGDSKLPINLKSKAVAHLKPSLNSVAKTLPFEYAELNFSHVEPTAVTGTRYCHGSKSISGLSIKAL